MTDWTNEQINVFDASGNVLVYASAGSGKTSVMVKKIVDDVVKGVPVKDILVVSYTKASATDMRLKIINALFDVAKDENVKDVDKIREEIDNLPFAEIGTMDSFLSRLIKENFEYLKISPKAQQMDETESKDMKRRALKKVMNDEYEKQAEDFIRVASRASGIVDDTPLSEIVLKIYDAISINPRPDEFKAMLLSSVTDNPDSVYGKVILDFYRDLAAETLPFARRAIDVTSLGGAPDYAAALRYSVEILEKLSDMQNSDDAKKIIAEFVKPKFSSRKSIISDEDKELVATARKKTAEIIENLSKKLFVDYTNYNVNDAKEFMRVVMRVVEEFDREYERLKKRENKIDFADLSKYAVKLLKDESRAEEI
ncbi:MAG: UvrD-helicase domain-containing protein, partial [Eubacteriales bacterium]|nr:UvrD-helicase domain-containing protein [Eubacteriales bacterium]